MRAHQKTAASGRVFLFPCSYKPLECSNNNHLTIKMFLSIAYKC
ncbi:Treslin [Bienertia sinuspersici]